MLRPYGVIHIPVESDMSASTLVRLIRMYHHLNVSLPNGLQGVTERPVGDSTSKQLVCFKTTYRKFCK